MWREGGREVWREGGKSGGRKGGRCGGKGKAEVWRGGGWEGSLEGGWERSVEGGREGSVEEGEKAEVWREGEKVEGGREEGRLMLTLHLMRAPSGTSAGRSPLGRLKLPAKSSTLAGLPVPRTCICSVSAPWSMASG